MPRVLAVCADPGVIGAPFYVMERVTGEVLTEKLPPALSAFEERAQIADQLIANGRVVSSGRAYLGVRVATIVGGGVLVSAIVPGGPAAKAGIKPGDVILAVNGKPAPTADVLVSVLADLHPGQKVPVKLLRHGKELTVTVTLGELRD